MNLVTSVMPTGEQMTPAAAAPWKLTIAEFTAIIAILMSIFNLVNWYTNGAVKQDRTEQTVARHDADIRQLNQLDSRMARIETKLDIVLDQSKGQKQ